MIGRIEQACEVHYPDHREISVDIVHAVVELLKENPLGQVKNGLLQNGGSLAKDGMRLEEYENNRGSYGVQIIGSRSGHALLDIDSQKKELAIYEDLYYLPIRYVPPDLDVRSGTYTASPTVSGIVLGATGSGSHDGFVRLGQFDIFMQPEPFKHACRQFGGEVKGKQLERYSDGQWGRN